MPILPLKNRLTKSRLLTVVLERDPDCEGEWLVVEAYDAERLGEARKSRFHHAPDCACKEQGRLCDIGWLEEFVSCVGTKPLIRDANPPSVASTVQFNGRMVSERFESIEGVDYDERFEVLLEEQSWPSMRH